MPSLFRSVAKAANSVPRSKVMLHRREGGKACKCRSIPAMTPAEWRLGLRARKVKRLQRSTSEVRLVLPYSRLKISRSPSQCLRLLRSAISCGRASIVLATGIWSRVAFDHSVAGANGGLREDGATAPGDVHQAHRHIGRWFRGTPPRGYPGDGENSPQSVLATKLLTSDQRYKRRVPACGRSCRRARDARWPWSVQLSDNSLKIADAHRDDSCAWAPDKSSLDGAPVHPRFAGQAVRLPPSDRYRAVRPNPDADGRSSCAFLERESNPYKF